MDQDLVDVARATSAEGLVDLSVAIGPNDAQAVPELVKSIVEGFGDLPSGGDRARHALILHARNLVQALETPRESMIKHTWAQPGNYAALLTGIDSGLWALMVKNGDRPQKVTELAESLGFDPVLLGRLMRHLAAMGHLVETGEDEYKTTNFIKSLTVSHIWPWYSLMLGGAGRSQLEFFKWARKNNWKNPNDMRNTSQQMAYNQDSSVDAFTFLRSQGFGPLMNLAMRGYRQGRQPWFEFYPVQKALIDGAVSDSEAPFLVDISGGLGQDISQFRRKFPSTPGKLILEDLAVVLSDIKDLDPSIQLQPYDFYTEQPAKNSRAYFMHSVLHDWPDETCRSILANVSNAMKPGYSKLLIHDVVLPRKASHWEHTAEDMLMMTTLAALERTEQQWHDLLENSGLGLKIVKIWSSDSPAVEALIECERDESRRDSGHAE